MIAVERGIELAEYYLGRFPDLIPRLSMVLWYGASLRLLENNLVFPTGENAIPPTLAAATVLLTGKMADALSTINAIRSQRKSHNFGIPYPLVEGNPFLPNYPSEGDLFKRKQMLLQIGIVTTGVAMPLVGISAGMHSLAIAASNELLRRKANRDLAASHGIKV